MADQKLGWAASKGPGCYSFSLRTRTSRLSLLSIPCFDKRAGISSAIAGYLITETHLRVFDFSSTSKIADIYIFTK